MKAKLISTLLLLALWQTQTFALPGSNTVSRSFCSFLPPVIFIDYTCKYNGTSNEITWVVDGEEDSTYYEVQRSEDGVIFTTIRSLQRVGAPGVKKTYNHTDVTIDKKEDAYYYRVAVGNTNGIIDYSKTVKLAMPGNGFRTEVLPNPFSTELGVRITAQRSSQLRIQVTDLSGRVLINQEAQVTNGTTLIDLSNAGSLARGHYVLTIWNDNQKHTSCIRRK